MYKLKADGVVFYDPSSNDMSLQVLSPKAKFELNKADTLEFTMLPGNVAYDSLQKMKTIITLEDDGEVIFRGRVLGTTTDLYNQKDVYCEGELGYLYDSLVRPYEYKGKASDLFRQLVAEHNAQVDSYKHFQVGIITAVTDEDETETESEAYTSTYAELRQMLVTKFGGYLRVRTSGGVRYLDYIDEYNEGDSAPINFGENLVDIEEKYEAGDVFSVLVPLGGYNTKHKDAITIAEVNGGLDYIESPSAIAKYGRIVKTYKWEELTDPQEILEKGQEHIAKMEEERTLVIKAYDLHGFGQGNRIRLGSHVMLDSAPHGLNGKDICSKLELDIEAPDQSEYTFGLPPETLTDNNASVAKKLKQNDDELSKFKEWLTVTDTELTLAKQWISENGDIVSNVMFKMDAMNANILLKADQTVVTEMETRISNAEILIDGANAAIDLKADRTTVTELEYRVSDAEILIDGLNAEIKLVATQKSIDEMAARLSAAEIEIDGMDAKIKLLATESSISELEERVTQAEIGIDGAKTQIDLWAGELDNIGNRLSGAEVRINGAESAVEILAEEIRLAGYVKASDLETEVLAVMESANIYGLTVTSLNAYSISGGSGNFDNVSAEWFTMGGSTVATEDWVEEQGYLKEIPTGSLDGFVTAQDVKNYCEPTYATQTHSHSVSVGSDGTITLGEVSSSGGSFNIADTAYYKNGVSAAKNSVTLTNGGWQGGSNVVKASNGKSLTVNLPTFSVSGGDSFNSNHQTTVYFHTSSVNGPLKSKAVDATPVYNSGYDTGYSNGETTGYNVGYAQARPASVSRTAGYDASNNAYNVTVVVTSNDNTTRTYALESISAREARNAGFNSGYDSGYTDGQASIDTGAYYDEGYDIGYSVGYAAGFKAAKDAVKVTAGISWSNPAQYYAMVRYWGRATINGEEVGYAAASESKNISGYV